MLKKVYESTIFGIAGIVVTVIGGYEFYRMAILPRFK